MRTLCLCALLMVLLLGSLQLTSSAPAVHHADCCPKLTAVKKIPLRQVESYIRTSGNCTVKAIVFNTKAGKQFCVDPDVEWVKGHVAILDQRHNTTPLTTNPTIPSTPPRLISDCCAKLTEVRIPLREVESYRWTHSDCPLKAIM
ncbi:C-C motif chemokine 13-like [Salminus brasiliensis]|uniref:C-C motif chemokine 13-like n=1 Tax=Salminus brasiliensis TaxID=930266 RepID=UPI003B832092